MHEQGMPAQTVVRLTRERSAEWSAEQVRELTQLWMAGLSAVAIGERLGLPTASVIGTAHRLRLPQPSPVLLLSRPELSGHADTRGVTVTSARASDSADARRQRRAYFQALGVCRRRCAWPLWGDGRPTHQHCDMRAVRGRPYCVEHCVIAYVPIDPTKQAPFGYYEKLARNTGTNAADFALAKLRDG